MDKVSEAQAESRAAKEAAVSSSRPSPAEEVAAERQRNERMAEDAEKTRSTSGNKQRQAVEDIANGNGDGEDGEITQAQAMDAADWFLAPDPEEDVATKRFRLRVGRPNSDREWVYWTVKSLGRERIQQIRESERRPNRKRGQEATTDEVQANLRIAAEGTIEPDLMDVKGKMVDPADALKARLSFKPGLIDQIAAEVISVTGYSDDDIDEIAAVKSS